MKLGNAITLKYQHDYIEDSILVYGCEKCVVYLIADEEKYPNSYVKLEFERVQCVRSAATDCSPAIGIYPKESDASFIVELTASKWPIEAHKEYTYSGSELKPRGHHFVVTNHDVFHEILAESFTESIVQSSESEFKIIKVLFS